MKVHLRGVLADALGPGDVGERQLAEDAERQDAPLACRQLCDERAEVASDGDRQLAAAGEPCLGDVVQRDLAPFRSQDVAALVHRNVMQPGGEARLTAERAEVFPGMDEGSLRGLVGLIVIAEHAEGQPVDAALMTFDEGFERLRRPAACPRDQCCVIHARQNSPGVTPDDSSTSDERG